MIFHKPRRCRQKKSTLKLSLETFVRFTKQRFTSENEYRTFWHLILRILNKNANNSDMLLQQRKICTKEFQSWNIKIREILKKDEPELSQSLQICPKSHECTFEILMQVIYVCEFEQNLSGVHRYSHFLTLAGKKKYHIEMRIYSLCKIFVPSTSMWQFI